MKEWTAVYTTSCLWGAQCLQKTSHVTTAVTRYCILHGLNFELTETFHLLRSLLLTLWATHLIPAWISNYIPSKVWDEITYPFPNFNGESVELWVWISNFIPHLSGLDTYFFRNLSVGQPSNNMDLSEIEIYLGTMIISFLFRKINRGELYICIFNFCFKITVCETHCECHIKITGVLL